MSTIVYFSEVCERGNYSKKMDFIFIVFKKSFKNLQLKKNSLQKSLTAHKTLVCHDIFHRK